MVSGAPSGSLAVAANETGVPRGTVVAVVARMSRSGGRLPSSELTPASALTIRPAQRAGPLHEPPLAVASSVVSAVAPDTLPVLSSSPTTPAANGEAALVPQNPCTRFAVAAGLGPASPQNGAHTSTEPAGSRPPEPKFEPPAGAVPAVPPTHVTPAVSQGAQWVASQQTMKQSSLSTSVPLLPAAATWTMPIACSIGPSIS